MRICLSVALVVAVAGTLYAQPSTVTTYAGAIVPPAGMPAGLWAIGSPGFVTPDGAGGFYLSSDQNAIYRVLADGTIRLIAGNTYGIMGNVLWSGGPLSDDGGPAAAARIRGPQGIAVDATGNLYFADSNNNRIRKVTTAGVISTIAGDGGSSGDIGDSGPAVKAHLDGPTSIAIDSGGSLYIADIYNCRVRKVTTDGLIRTIAGTGAQGYSGDGGPAVEARLGGPIQIAVDAAGNVYIADTLNSRVRKVSLDGIVQTIAGTGQPGSTGDGGPALAARIVPVGIAVDAASNLYVSEPMGTDPRTTTTNPMSRIRKITAAGVITTIAGNGSVGYSGDGGAATAAQLNFPSGVAVDPDGNVYIADNRNHRIRKVAAAGTISSVSGEGTEFGFNGNPVLATAARLRAPSAIAFDKAGNLYIADTGNQRVRRVAPDGAMTTIAGNGNVGSRGDGGPAIAAELDNPTGVAVDAGGTVYISTSCRVRAITADGLIKPFAGKGSCSFSGDGGKAVDAQLSAPSDLAVASDGTVYIVDSINHRIRKVTTDGIISTVAGTGSSEYDGDGGPATAASLGYGLQAIAVGGDGSLYITSNNAVRRISPNGIISTVAGIELGWYGGDGSAATVALLNSPSSVAVDAAGNLYIADAGNHRIREVGLDGVIATIAGNNGTFGAGEAGGAAAAQLQAPTAVALGSDGNLYIADSEDHTIWKLVRQPPDVQFSFAVPNLRVVTQATAGGAGSVDVGYARLSAAAGSTVPGGFAIFGLRQQDTLVSEVAVPASPLLRTGRLPVVIGDVVKTGVAIANPNNAPVTVSFYFTNANGDFGNASTVIPANSQTARFLDQSPFNSGASVSGTFTFSSSAPVAVIGLQGLTNERGDFLMTALPVVDLSAISTDALVIPHYAHHGGWTTEIVLVNPTDTPLAGTLQFLDQSGNAALVTLEGRTSSTFSYSIPPRALQRMKTAEDPPSPDEFEQPVLVGSVRILPGASSAAPSAHAIFSFRKNGVTVTEAAVQAVVAGTAFRLYVEASGDFGNGLAGSIQTGIAITNLSNAPANVAFELTESDGTSYGRATGYIPGNGQTAFFLNQIGGLIVGAEAVQGVVRITSDSPIAVVGLRGRYNERNDFLITTTPPVNEGSPNVATELVFPHFANAGGYRTQFILFSTSPATSSGTLRFYTQSGQPWELPLR